jgi:hypothetical protein
VKLKHFTPAYFNLWCPMPIKILNCQLQTGDHVAVYPVFKNLDISSVFTLREKPVCKFRFIIDVNLGELAKRLRLLGFDCLYRIAWYGICPHFEAHKPCN